jgi:hypothetical protein
VSFVGIRVQKNDPEYRDCVPICQAKSASSGKEPFPPIQKIFPSEVIEMNFGFSVNKVQPNRREIIIFPGIKRFGSAGVVIPDLTDCF